MEWSTICQHYESKGGAKQGLAWVGFGHWKSSSTGENPLWIHCKKIHFDPLMHGTVEILGRLGCVTGKAPQQVKIHYCTVHTVLQRIHMESLMHGTVAIT